MRSSIHLFNGMCVADATCIIETYYKNPGDADRETTGNLKSAAYKLMKECVMGQGRGGIVRGLGQNSSIHCKSCAFVDDIDRRK